MLSERRWSDSSSALKFFKAKASQFTSSSSTPSTPSPASSSSASSPSSSPFFPSTSSSSSNSSISPPVVTMISEDFPDTAQFFHRNSLPSSLSIGSIDGLFNNGDAASGSTTSSDDAVPDFPAGELKSGSGGDNFIKRLWRRKKSLTINEYDPSFKVIYLGNVLTGWAKGEGCVDRPLATLWKNYKAQNGKQDIHMKLTVSNSGLKAVTKEHGLTEYWSNRVTFCNTHPRFPKVFCWVYRHEGRRLKQELRCHAVLCPSESKATKLAQALQERLHFALQEFRRDKLNRQKARLSLANCVYDVPSLPRRKQLLSTGMSNYRPPLERSKSAPKLKSIEEGLEEPTLEDLIEEEEPEEETSTTTSSPAISNKTETSVGEHQDAIEEDEDREDEVSFAYNIDNIRKCDRCTDARCRCEDELPPTCYGDLPGQLLDVGEAEEEEDNQSNSSSSSASPPTGVRLLPRGSLPGQIEPGPVRAAPSPEPSRSSFSLGSPVCPGNKRKCAAGLCDELFCRGRATSTLLGAELARLQIASHKQDDDEDIIAGEEIECNNNRLLVSSGKNNVLFTSKDNKEQEQDELPEEKEIFKAVTITGLVGCFRQSKA